MISASQYSKTEVSPQIKSDTTKSEINLILDTGETCRELV